MDEKSLNELLECSVCLDRLDHTSKVLPCQHTFCRRCLEEIVSTKRELRCPECRTVVTIRVDDLPPNILLIRLLEGLKTQEHLLGQKSASPHSSRQGHDIPSSSVPVTSIQSHQPRQISQPCAKALFNYEAKESGDLSFKKNDIVILRKQIDENWYHGELNGQHGFFPATYVQVLVPLPQVPQCQALFDFDLKDEKEKDCLAFQKDEKLTVIRRVDDNWIEGRKGDKIGIFPITFVKLNDAAKSLLNTQSNIGLIQSSNHATTSSGERSQRGEGHRVPMPPSSSSSSSPSPNSALLASRTAQQKRHSFTPTSEKTPSPTNQNQRRSLELSSSGAFSSVAAASPSGSPITALTTTTPSSVAATAGQKSVSTQAATLPDLLTGSAAGSENSCVVSSSLTTPVYMAMYNYKPQKDDEVELRKGDYYTVTEKCQDGWFKGQCLKTGNVGVYPGNYVQMIRHSSAFKPVNPNVLNIRAKGPLSPPPSLTAAVTTSSIESSGVPASTEILSSNISHLASSNQAPPLLPRSSKTRTASPSSAAVSKSSKSSSLLHGAVMSSRLPAALPTSPSVPSKSSSSHSHSRNSHLHSGASGHVSRRSNHHSGGSGAATSASLTGGQGWSANLAAVQHTMSTTSNITPPNVVLGAVGDSVSAHSKEKKEKKDKEKKSLVKLLAGKAKKSKSPGGEIDTLTDMSVSHVRSGSYPSDGGAGALGDSPHKKTGSFDSSSSPPQSAKPMRPKPLVREKYRCIVPYPPHSDHELELQMGDVVYVHKKREDGWFKGTLARSGKTGLFPGSFVEKME